MSEESKQVHVISLDQLKARAEQVETTFVDLTGAGMLGGFWIRELTGQERREARKLSGKMRVFQDNSVEFDVSNLPKFAEEKLIIMAVVKSDTDTSPYFTGKSSEMYDLISRAIKGKAMEALLKKIREFNGLDAGAVDRAKND